MYSLRNIYKFYLSPQQIVLVREHAQSLKDFQLASSINTLLNAYEVWEDVKEKFSNFSEIMKSFLSFEDIQNEVDELKQDVKDLQNKI